MKITPLEEATYQDLVDDASRDALNLMLKHGGQGLHDAIFFWLDRAIRWSNLKNEKLKKG